MDINALKSFFLKNSKLKLPWSDSELNYAKNYCKEIFDIKEYK